MRIPISDEEIGLVKTYYGSKMYCFYRGDHDTKQGGRLMTWRDFKAKFPIRGYHLCNRYEKLKDKYH